MEIGFFLALLVVYGAFEYSAKEKKERNLEAENIVASLKHENISNQKMNLQGWMNGGYYHDPVSSVSVLRKLGGTKGLSSLQDALARSGGALYPDAALQRKDT